MTATITCAIRKVPVPVTPEEIIRQDYIKRLIDEYGYPESHIDVEVWIDDGSGKVEDVDTGKPKRADIVIYRSATKTYDEIEIIVECKKDDVSAGERQLKSYGNRTTAEILVWHNGKLPTKYWQRKRKPNTWNPKAWLPRYGQDYSDKVIKKSEIQPSRNLVAIFDRIHNDIYANAKSGNKSKVFYQVIYLLFAKIEDELRHDSECKFIIFDREFDDIQKGIDSASFRERIIDDLFAAVKKRPQFKDVFDQNDRIEIPLLQVANIVSELEYISILETDAKGDAFQSFLSAHFRGDAGQFFTPDPIKQMIVDMVEPRPDEVVLDPACGSSGFLIFTLNRWKESVKTMKKYVDSDGKAKRDAELTESERQHIKAELKLLAKDYIRGVDFDNDLTKVAKMYMVMVDDGHTGIFTLNSLLPFSEIAKATNGQISESCANVILTNPPFGTRGKVRQSDILREYDFGYTWKKQADGTFVKDKFIGTKKKSGQVPDILFIERCYQLLVPGGLLAIVLPDGDFTNQNTEFVRYWILQHFQVLGIISLAKHTFDPYGTGVKSCVLIAQKPKGKNIPSDYPIFFASLESIGYDIRGRTTYQRINGNVIDNEGSVIGYAISRDGLKPPKRDKRNYPLDENGTPIEVYYDEINRRLYKAKDGIPLDKNGKPVTATKDEFGNFAFEQDDNGRILDGSKKPKPIPFDQFSRQQDRELIEQYGAIANDIPLIVESWRIFKEMIRKRQFSEIKEKLESIYPEYRKTDEYGLPQKRLFYTKMLSEINAIYRLHPDYWHFRYDVLLQRLESNTVPLGGKNGIATLKGGATPLGSNYVSVDDDGIPFLRIQNVGNFGLILDDLVYISREVHEGSLKRSQLHPGDVLFTITGRLGSVTVIPESIAEANINQHIVRIRIKDDFKDEFSPGFIAAHLRSSIMRELVEREQYGTTRIALDYKTIETFRIPRVPKDKQDEIAAELLKASEMLAKMYVTREKNLAKADDEIMQFLRQSWS